MVLLSGISTSPFIQLLSFYPYIVNEVFVYYRPVYRGGGGGGEPPPHREAT